MGCKHFYESYYKRKTLKKDIYDELVSIAWHPVRYWDWCIDEEKKQETMVERSWN